MNKYNCEIIQDLLALYHDGVCSEESRMIVEEHLSQCKKCSAVGKQLSDTALETDLIVQTKSVLKTHRKRQRKKISLMLLVIFGVLSIVAGVFLLNLKQTYTAIKTAIYLGLPEVREGAQYFDGYDISDDNTVTIETDAMLLDIPADYVKQDVELSGFVCYKSEKNSELSVIAGENAEDLSFMGFLNYGSYQDNEVQISESHRQELIAWFGKLGLGLPDSAYGTYKCIYLLDNDCRSSDDLEQNLAYIIAAVLKNKLCNFGDVHYIYETEEKCGIIKMNMPNDSKDVYYAQVDLFKPDDLNTAYSVIITAESPDEVFAVINSIKLR